MPSLWGIETKEDACLRIDELLQLNATAQREKTKEAVFALNEKVTGYYKGADSSRMSAIERTFFSRMAHIAFTERPRLNSRRSWEQRLFQMESTLQLYRSRLSL